MGMIWVVRRTNDAMKPLRGTKIVFSEENYALAYIDKVLHGYGVVYSIPLHNSMVLSREQFNTLGIVQHTLI